MYLFCYDCKIRQKKQSWRDFGAIFINFHKCCRTNWVGGLPEDEKIPIFAATAHQRDPGESAKKNIQQPK